MKNIDYLVRREIIKMEEINWGDIPDTNPYRLLWGENQEILPICISAMKSELTKVNLYPSATKITLRKAIAKYCSVDAKNIIVTNGSDEALELIAKVFISKNDEVIIPVPSYPCFESVSQMMGAIITKISLEKDFSLSLESLIKKITTKTKIIWIANPNNPTGNVLVTKKQIETLAQKTNALIVIDESYFELTGVTAVSLISKYPNIIVTRSFSKIFSLAGVRLGYIIANSVVTKYLNRLEQTNQVFNVNRFALAAGTAILKNENTIKQAIKRYIKIKRSFGKLLSRLRGVTILPTKTTFCLLKLPKGKTAKEVKNKLLKLQIYVKDCSIYKGLGPQYLYLGAPRIMYQKKVVKALENTLL